MKHGSLQTEDLTENTRTLQGRAENSTEFSTRL